MLLTPIMQAVYLMLPAYFANMAPVLVRKVPFLDYPIDGGVKLFGKPMFGRHKTYRGLFFGVSMGVVIAYVQFRLYYFEVFRTLSLVDYNNWIFIGFLLGFGAIVGDLVKSFFKRRVGIKSGLPWVPFDQIDFVAGALLFLVLEYVPSLVLVCIVFILSMFLHVLVNHLAFYTKIRKEKW